MTVFLVCIKCDCIVMSVDGKRGAYGFYKNEYVQAIDSSAAADAAKLRLRNALQQNATVAAKDALTAVLEIDEIEEGFDESDLLTDEGFVFFESEKRC